MAMTSIPLKNITAKIFLLTGCLLASAVLVLFAKWSFGNSISTQVGDKVVAEFAISLAPKDPQTHYSLAVLSEKTFLPEDQERSLNEYHAALALSPDDYRLWLAYAKALERTGDSANADIAFKKANELAPNYSQVNWAYGNFLLRQGQNEPAFALIRKAAESNPTYLSPAVSTALQYLDGDLEKIRGILGSSPELNSTLAVFLADEKRFDESLQIWNSLPAETKKTQFKSQGDGLFQKFVQAKRFRGAFEVFKSISNDESINVEPEAITNGGFENDVLPTGAIVFDWQLGNVLQPQIGFDEAQKTEGRRSLVFVFNSGDGKDFRSLTQTVVVRPNSKYRLGFSYKTDLKTLATFRWEVVNLEDKVLAESAVLNQRTEWNKIDLDFTTSATGEAVVIRLARAQCPNGICPISGKVWFDDFRIDQ